MLISKKQENILFILFLILLACPLLAKADTVGEKRVFLIETEFDVSNRVELKATLQERTDKLYFYIENDWWNKFGITKQAEIKSALSSLSFAFENEIYPKLTTMFGFEDKPGIDGDERITILIHSMKNGMRGYIRTNDGYSKLQITDSNEREIIYLNANYLTEELSSSYLAHEFQHLITFNQREKRLGITEEVWFQEIISEYAPTAVGYDDDYSNSNLKQRADIFLADPTDSLTEWKGKVSDYGVSNIFVQYLVDQYGVQILKKSLESSEIGINALNSALKQIGSDRVFAEVFNDWLIAVLVNDCSYGKEYCFKNDLKDLKISPSLNFLPFIGKTSLTVEDDVKDWSGKWYKLVGGRDNLQIDFNGIDGIDFHLSYLLCSKQECELKKLILDENEEGIISISNFNDYEFLTLIISSNEKQYDFGSSEPMRLFSFKASTTKDDTLLIESLIKQIAILQKEILRVQSIIAGIIGKGGSNRCIITSNLSIGARGNEVRCLQEFLKSQGSIIYPEGIVSGYFGNLTKNAVIRFQEKYASEILYSWGLNSGNGFIGVNTRNKINNLINF